MMSPPSAFGRFFDGSGGSPTRVRARAIMDGKALRAVQPDADDLAALLSRAGEGDRIAFRAVYAATSRRLYGILMKILRDPAQAQEALQEVYLRIWQRAGTYRRDQGEPLAWMVALARHRAIDQIRSDRRRAVEACADAEVLDSVAGIGVDFEARDSLSGCLDRLDVQQRSCILLAYVHGYSREELALRFDRPVNTIKTWLHRSLASLKSCMEHP